MMLTCTFLLCVAIYLAPHQTHQGAQRLARWCVIAAIVNFALDILRTVL